MQLEQKGCFPLKPLRLGVTCVSAASLDVKIIMGLNYKAWVILNGDRRPGFSHVV